MLYRISYDYRKGAPVFDKTEVSLRGCKTYGPYIPLVVDTFNCRIWDGISFCFSCGKMGVAIFFAYGLYLTFKGEWMSMKLRCPRCDRHCGLKFSEIEDVAQEKMDFIERSRTI